MKPCGRGGVGYVPFPMSTALTCAFFRLISGVARGQMFRPETRPRARPRGSVAVVPENLSGGGRYVGGLGAALGFGAGQMVGPELGYASGATPEARLGAWSYEADFLRQNGAWRVKVGSRRGGAPDLAKASVGLLAGRVAPLTCAVVMVEAFTTGRALGISVGMKVRTVTMGARSLLADPTVTTAQGAVPFFGWARAPARLGSRRQGRRPRRAKARVLCTSQSQRSRPFPPLILRSKPRHP